ncbi:MAG: hypothetical protein IK025_10060 [Bacteroidales bacterium]|nr:hypothetical protein [Bacteroidales bacterium]
MTYNITDEQLNEIVKRAVQKTLEELQVEPVLHEDAPVYGKKNKDINISIADDDLAARTMETMSQNLDTQNNPKVGIFWYSPVNKSLYGVVAIDKDSYSKPNAGGGLITCKELHEDVWKREYRNQKYKLNGVGPYIGDYKNKPRGRVFYSPEKDTYYIMVGSWINDNPEAVDIIVDRYDLKDCKVEVKISVHWEIGMGWENR